MLHSDFGIEHSTLQDRVQVRTYGVPAELGERTDHPHVSSGGLDG